MALGGKLYALGGVVGQAPLAVGADAAGGNERRGVLPVVGCPKMITLNQFKDFPVCSQKLPLEFRVLA